MSNSFNKDLIVDCVKNIFESNRCVSCDKSEGTRSRYSCGHATCDECVAVESYCLQCETPQTSSSPSQPVLDDSLTQRAKNAAELLKVCQSTFNIDVYQRQRLSEQLKIEKELFPDCIQAPVKYSNKRKSFNVSLKRNKENRHSILPGERVSPLKNSKMEKSTYIKQWLEKSESTLAKSPRKPFADLSVNYQMTSLRQSTPIKKRGDIILDKGYDNSDNIHRGSTKKRPHFKTSLSTERVDKYLKPAERKDSHGAKRIKKSFDQWNESKISNKHDKDESGIVSDFEPIVIEDSQPVIIDKDKQAWLAVLEAEKNVLINSTPSLKLECSEVVKYTDDIEKTLSKSISFQSDEPHVNKRVPFYKKSYLLETCNQCNGRKNICKQMAGQSKDVSITIENSSFITTIKVSNNTSSPQVGNKQSTSVQTDIKGLNEQDDEVSMKSEEYIREHDSVKLATVEPFACSNIEVKTQSLDMFTDEARIVQEQEPNQEVVDQLEVKTIVSTEVRPRLVADSDTDDEVNNTNVMEVKADVHRSSDQLNYGVLAEVDHSDQQRKGRRAKRRSTPGSTDSSEKENLDPNRAKKANNRKKGAQKKNRKKHDVSEFDSIYIVKD